MFSVGRDVLVGVNGDPFQRYVCHATVGHRIIEISPPVVVVVVVLPLAFVIRLYFKRQGRCF